MQTISHIQTYPRRPPKAMEYKYSMDAVQFSSWKTAMEFSLRNDPRWNKYDSDINEIAAVFNRHFQGSDICKPGFFIAPSIDKKLIKAIICTETGPAARNRAWDTRPMQIGNIGDLGINDVLSTDGFTGENIKLILPEQYRYLSYENIRKQPKENIIAGTAYLLLRACTFATINLIEEGKPLEVPVTKELNNYERIAKATESTVETIRLLNPRTNPSALRIGQKLLYLKSFKKRVIYSIERLDFNCVSSVYNVNGDASYKDKLEFFFNI